MEADNFENTLSAFQSRRPFRQFTVVLIDGDRFEVDHAGALVHRVGVAMYISPGGVPIIFDHEGVSQFVGDLKPQESNTEP